MKFYTLQSLYILLPVIIVWIAIPVLIQSYPMPQMRICIQSTDPSQLANQCIYCRSRIFQITVRLCTGNVYLPARMTLNEATCLVNSCRRQLPRMPPEPFMGQGGGVVIPGGGLGVAMPGYGGMNEMGGSAMMNANGHGHVHNHGHGHAGNHNDEEGGGHNNNNNNIDSNGEDNVEETESLMSAQAVNVRPPAKFVVGKPQKFQNKIKNPFKFPLG